MVKFDRARLDVTVEVVTTTFVASGRPVGIHDLGRMLDNLNNPALFRQFEIEDPVVRPLYRAGHQVALGAPLLVRRDDIVFANFEGPAFTREGARLALVDAPALLLAPPFQIAGIVSVPTGADPTQAMRTLMQTFFVVRNASVYDADGNMLGEGEQIIVNGSAVQMGSPTRKHIEALTRAPLAAANNVTAEQEDNPASQGARAA